jgi:acetyl-CoA acyltransferase 1
MTRAHILQWTSYLLPTPHLLRHKKQASYCCSFLNLPADRVNVNGGAIALGHPLGATGARCTATLLHEMKKQGPACRFGVVSMCIGSGMGAAAVFEAGAETAPFTNAGPVRGKQTNLSRDAVL